MFGCRVNSGRFHCDSVSLKHSWLPYRYIIPAVYNWIFRIGYWRNTIVFLQTTNIYDLERHFIFIQIHDCIVFASDWWIIKLADAVACCTPFYSLIFHRTYNVTTGSAWTSARYGKSQLQRVVRPAMCGFGVTFGKDWSLRRCRSRMWVKYGNCLIRRRRPPRYRCPTATHPTERVFLSVEANEGHEQITLGRRRTIHETICWKTCRRTDRLISRQT